MGEQLESGAERAGAGAASEADQGAEAVIQAEAEAKGEAELVVAAEVADSAEVEDSSDQTTIEKEAEAGAETRKELPDESNSEAEATSEIVDAAESMAVTGDAPHEVVEDSLAAAPASEAEKAATDISGAPLVVGGSFVVYVCGTKGSRWGRAPTAVVRSSRLCRPLSAVGVADVSRDGSIAFAGDSRAEDQMAVGKSHLVASSLPPTDRPIDAKMPMPEAAEEEIQEEVQAKVEAQVMADDAQEEALAPGALGDADGPSVTSVDATLMQQPMADPAMAGGAERTSQLAAGAAAALPIETRQAGTLRRRRDASSAASHPFEAVAQRLEDAQR